MRLLIQFAGSRPMPVDTEGTIDVFEKLTATEAAPLLEAAAMGDADERGWIAANIGGEDCQIKLNIERYYGFIGGKWQWVDPHAVPLEEQFPKPNDPPLGWEKSQRWFFGMNQGREEWFLDNRPSNIEA